MRRSLVLSAVAGTAVTAGLLIVLSVAGVPSPPSPTSPRLPTDLPAAAAPDVGAPSPTTGAPARIAAGFAPRTATATGRLIDADTGAAVPAGTVAVGDERSVRSAADGRFALPLLADGLPVDLAITAPGRVAVDVRATAAAGGVDVGDVPLQRGGSLRGRLADERGQPLAEAAIRLRLGSRPPAREGHRQRFAIATRTCADGSFAFPTPLPPGIVEVLATDAPPLCRTATVDIAAGGDHHVELVCRAVAAADCILGVVRDARGAARPGVLVEARTAPDATDGHTVAHARTGHDGAFRLLRGDGAPSLVWLLATPAEPSATIARGHGDAATPWGTVDAVVTLPAGDGVWLCVVDAERGVPIEHFAVQCVPVTGVRTTAAATVRHRGRHPGGRLWLAGLATGEHELIVWPEHACWLASLPLRFDVADPAAGLRVALPRAVACPVRVVTPDGLPVAGADVELLAPAASPLVRDLVDWFAHGGARGPVTMRLATGTTDADGWAALRWFDDPRPRALRIGGAHVVGHVEQDVRIGAHGVTVTTEDAGHVDLHVRGAAGARLTLADTFGARRLPEPGEPPLALDGDGRARIAAPAGTWQVTLWRPAPAARDGAPVWLPSPEPCATVAVQAGSRASVDLDLRAQLATGELAGAAFVDGHPAGHLALLCGASVPGGNVTAVHTIDGHVDANGRFLFPALPAGRYRLQLWLDAGGRRLAVPVGPWLPLAPGERRRHATIELTTASVAVSLQTLDGAAVTDGQLVLRAAAGFALLGSPDGSGTVRFAALPTGSYRARLRTADESFDLGDVEVGPQATTATLTVR